MSELATIQNHILEEVKNSGVESPNGTVEVSTDLLEALIERSFTAGREEGYSEGYGHGFQECIDA